jgi:hypothetical protein
MAWCGFVFDLGACMCQNIKCSGRGSGCGSCELARASSEAESHLRGRPALERGGTPPEGAPALERGGTTPEGVFSPRARRSLGDMAVFPSSEAGFRPRGAGVDHFDGPPRLLRVVGPCHWAVVVLGVIYDS